MTWRRLTPSPLVVADAAIYSDIPSSVPPITVLTIVLHGAVDGNKSATLPTSPAVTIAASFRWPAISCRAKLGQAVRDPIRGPG